MIKVVCFLVVLVTSFGFDTRAVEPSTNLLKKIEEGREELKNESVQLIKGTSLASIIGFTELTRTGQIINNATFSPFLVFGTVAAFYFVLCWPLSLVARNMETRFSRATAR